MLAYHKIGAPPTGGWDTWHYIPESVFKEQMEYLRDSDWSVIDLPSFLAGLEAPATLPDRSLLLTFDDGHLSMRETALPILRQFGFPAVCFVPTDYIGGLSAFDAEVEPEEPMCDWDDLHELDRNGVAIQSHGLSHGWLSLSKQGQWEHEFGTSKRILEEGLGKPVEVFAFPYSDAGSNAEAINAALRKAGYLAAFLCGGGPSTVALPVPDPFRIDRLATYRDTNLDQELNHRTVPVGIALHHKRGRAT